MRATFVIKDHLDALCRNYGVGFREKDPVRYAHRYATNADREVVAFLAALLAFGKVEVVLRNLDDLFQRLGKRPAAMIAGLTAKSAKAAARGFRHRWIGEGELALLLQAVGRLLAERGSLEAVFLKGDDPRIATIEPGLRVLAERGLAATGRPRDRAMKFLFPSPDRGGACKRFNLFLRWVVRPADGIDLGLWPSIDRARLLIPLDTHVAFHARILGFSKRRQADWKMVEEVTAALRAIDPADPVRYDFALCHLGIHGDCRKKRDPMICPTCPIDSICRLPRRRAAR